MNAQEQVTEFHRAFGVAIAHPLDVYLRVLRAELIAEEASEAIGAIESGGLREISQELADLVYVAYGTAISIGVDLDAAITEVHRANMSKLGEDGQVILREDGKVLKPVDWVPPDMSLALPSGVVAVTVPPVAAETSTDPVIAGGTT